MVNARDIEFGVNSAQFQPMGKSILLAVPNTTRMIAPTKQVIA
jgi:hypothetical protein